MAPHEFKVELRTTMDEFIVHFFQEPFINVSQKHKVDNQPLACSY